VCDRPLPAPKDKVLFTPGPLTTSRTVKQAMLRDLGSRDLEFIEIVRDVRRRLLALGGVSENEYTAVLMQGAGTFGLESVVGSTVPRGGKLLVAVNGAYGRRLVTIAERLGIDTIALEYAEDEPPSPDEIGQALRSDPDIAQVSTCHCETTSGILNPVHEIGEVVAAAGRAFFVDAMSSFGAVPLHLGQSHVDYLCSSANKCVEGVPGFSFVLARIDPLLASEGHGRSVSLDLLAQYRGLERNGQFRFTPPVQAILAYRQALIELEQEGGVAGRAARYRENHETLVAGMEELGFREFLPPDLQGAIITSFLSPDHPNWDFDRFYGMLSDEGFVIYPGKVGSADCFRIGTVGHIDAADVRNLLAAIERVLGQMDVVLGDSE
jgi:2-aminoethylphosphonate-pyruvate transaminase